MKTFVFQCRHILTVQKESLATGNVFEKLKHGTINIGAAGVMAMTPTSTMTTTDTHAEPNTSTEFPCFSQPQSHYCEYRDPQIR